MTSLLLKKIISKTAENNVLGNSNLDHIFPRSYALWETAVGTVEMKHVQIIFGFLTCGE